MAIIPFENVRSLGIVAGLGLISLTFDELVLMIPALSSVTLRELQSPHFKKIAAKAAGGIDLWLARLVRWIIDRPAVGTAIIAGCVAVTVFLGWDVADTPVGQDNTYAIHNYLTKSWNRSDLYKMEREISARFGGVYTMTVLVDGVSGETKSQEDPAILKAVDKLAVFLRSQTNVGYVADPALYVKTRYAFVHGIDKAYNRVPDTRQEIGEGLEAFAAITPGAYDWLYGEDYNSCVITAYCASTDPVDVDHLIKGVKTEANRLFKDLPVRVGIAGGSLGIAQAFNNNIRYWLIVGALLGFLGTFALAVPFIRSLSLPALLLIPLILGTIAALGIMVMAGVKLNSNTTAALAIASGVGIDSQVYLLYRIREEYERLGDFKESLIQGFVKIMKALLVSNGALILGCWVLVPIPLYVGYVGFGMGLVLAACFVMSAVISPILWSWMGKRVVIGRTAAATAAPLEQEVSVGG
jgi:predicted RND superfamily exporter protein